jgi:23S rRNA (uridine2552-2'-O)-methyltransferase
MNDLQWRREGHDHGEALASALGEVAAVAQDAGDLAQAQRALEVATRLLRPGGNFVVKVLEGGEMKAYLDACKLVFTHVKLKRPKSTRDGSTETFVIGLHRKPLPPPSSP